ncbi:MAG: ROK family protein, partial [Pseudonocardiales bacterium]
MRATALPSAGPVLTAHTRQATNEATPTPRATLGVDIGGTKLAIGVVDGSGQLALYRQHPVTNRSYAEVLDHVTDLADTIRADHPGPVDGVGVAMAGWLTPDRAEVVAAASLGWGRQALQRDLQNRLGLPTVVHNDANAAAWSEWTAAGSPAKEAFVLLTLGTDVGGGVIVDGRMLTGTNGVAGELGHLNVGLGSEPCVCGSRGCLAAYASGSAILTWARRLMQDNPADAARMLAETGGEPRRLNHTAFNAGVVGGDAAALAVIEQAAQAIAAASAQISRVIDHQHLVLGGGVSALGGVLVESVRNALAGTAPLGPVLPRPQVRIAAHGNRAGVIG